MRQKRRLESRPRLFPGWPWRKCLSQQIFRVEGIRTLGTLADPGGDRLRLSRAATHIRRAVENAPRRGLNGILHRGYALDPSDPRKPATGGSLVDEPHVTEVRDHLRRGGSQAEGRGVVHEE